MTWKKTGEKRSFPADEVIKGWGRKYGTAVVLILVVFSCFLIFYFHGVVKSDLVFTHFSYIPIILACLWWGRKGITVAVFLAALLISSHFFFRLHEPIINDYIRAFTFIVIAFVVSTLSKQLMGANGALRNTRDYLDKLIQYANAPIIVWGPDLKITRFNRAFEHLTGYTSDEVVGRELNMLFPESSRDESQQKIEKTLKGEYWNSVEIPILCKEGGVKLVLWSSANIYEVDEKTLLATIAQGTDITERKQIEKEINTSLKEKEMLLREIHHRVKNNMQIISSMLRLQSRSVGDGGSVDVFRESQNRIKSMALVHERLYQSRDLEHIDFNEYVSELVNGLVRSYGIDAGRITLNIDIEDVSLGIDLAIPCGLIINELISNSLKHAFPGGNKGEIRISLHPAGGGKTELTVSDNGVGIPGDVDFRKTETLGLQLVTTLAEDQLGGRIELDKNAGTGFRITFKK